MQASSVRLVLAILLLGNFVSAQGFMDFFNPRARNGTAVEPSSQTKLDWQTAFDPWAYATSSSSTSSSPSSSPTVETTTLTSTPSQHTDMEQSRITSVLKPSSTSFDSISSLSSSTVVSSSFSDLSSSTVSEAVKPSTSIISSESSVSSDISRDSSTSAVPVSSVSSVYSSAVSSVSSAVVSSSTTEDITSSTTEGSTSSIPSTTEVPFSTTEETTVSTSEASSSTIDVVTPSTSEQAPFSTSTEYTPSSSEQITFSTSEQYFPSSSSVEIIPSTTEYPFPSSTEESTSSSEYIFPSTTEEYSETTSQTSLIEPSFTNVANTSSVPIPEPMVSTTSEIEEPSSTLETSTNSETWATAELSISSTFIPPTSSSEVVTSETAVESTMPSLDTQTFVSTPSPSSAEVPSFSTSAPATVFTSPVPSSISSQVPSTTSSEGVWLPSTMVAEIQTSDSPTSATSISKIATETLPQAIAAATEVVRAPGYTLITVGFKKELNYPFAVSNPISNAQIFNYLPAVLDSPFEKSLTKEEIESFANTSVLELVPLKISKKSYLVTVAKVYFPEGSVSKLQKLILDSSSDLYNSKVAIQKELSSYIDPSIPLTGLVHADSGSLITSDNGDGKKDDNGDNDNSGNHSGKSKVNLGSLDDDAYSAFNRHSANGANGGSKNSSNGKTIGIIVGCIIGGTVVCFGCVYILALRIRNRKNQILANPIPDDQQSYDSYNYESSLEYNGQEKNISDGNDQVSISPSAKINNWIDYNNYSDYPEEAGVDSNMEKPVLTKKASQLKISRPIATENSLGWNDF